MEDEEEGAQVLGLGVGLFLIILTWSLALAAALLMARTAAGSGVTMVTIATLVTLLLLVIPRQVDTHNNINNLSFHMRLLTRVPVVKLRERERAKGRLRKSIVDCQLSIVDIDFPEALH